MNLRKDKRGKLIETRRQQIQLRQSQLECNESLFAYIYADTSFQKSVGKTLVELEVLGGDDEKLTEVVRRLNANVPAYNEMNHMERINSLVERLLKDEFVEADQPYVFAEILRNLENEKDCDCISH